MNARLARIDQNHPERQPDEFYLGDATERYFKTIGHTTKRLGVVPMDVAEEHRPFFRPVFVKQAELKAKGLID